MYRSLYMTEVKDVSNNANNVQQPQLDSTDKEEISDFLLTQVNKFTAGDLKSLYETFNLLEKDLASNGLRIFLETLSENPEYKYFWPQFRAIPDSSLISSSVLRDFALTYMNALKKIIESLNNKQIPCDILQRIAFKHTKHKVQTYHMQKMINPLLGNVRRALGRKDEIAERAWQLLIQTLATIIEYYKSLQT